MKPMANWLGKQGRERRDAEIVRLRTQYGLSHRQIGVRLGIHPTAVEKTLRRAREAAAEAEVIMDTHKGGGQWT